MSKEPVGVPLADFIGALRAELRAAALTKDPQLQFNVGPVTVEFTLMTHHEGGGKAGIRFWVVEAGASASVANESTGISSVAPLPRRRGRWPPSARPACWHWLTAAPNSLP